MLSAVHTDRSGRVYVSADYFAAGFDGASNLPLRGVPLPPDATLVPLAREAEGFDRAGRQRGLGKTRWALGALLPPGYTRTMHPAYSPTAEQLAPLPYAAVGADEGGQLVCAARITDAAAAHAGAAAAIGATAVSVGLRRHPGNALVKQVARCAREFHCEAAAAVFTGTGAAALPVAGDDADPPARRGLERAEPSDPAAFSPSATEIADVASAHLAGGGTMVCFGRACDGEPLAHPRLLEEAITRIRAVTRAGVIQLETDGQHPQALRRVLAAGLDAVTIRLDVDPDMRRRAVRRESLAAAAGAGAALAVCVPVFPGATDREPELDELMALLAALPGGTLILRDRGGDPRASTRGALLGVDRAVERLANELPRWRLAAFAPAPIPAPVS